MRNRIVNSVLILIAYVLTCAAVFTGPYFQAALTVNVGQVSPLRVAATRDVENIVATAYNRAEARARADELSRDAALFPDPSLNVQTYNNLYDFFNRLEAVRMEYYVWLLGYEEARSQAYSEWLMQVQHWEAFLIQRDQILAEGTEEQEILQDPFQPSAEFTFEYEEFPILERFSGFSVVLSQSQQELLLNLSDEEHNDLFFALLETAGFVLENHVVADIDLPVQMAVQSKLDDLIIDVLNVGYSILISSLVPNWIFDEETFLNMQQDIAENYQAIWLMEGQTIVDVGVPITHEHYAIMQELGMLESDWTRDILPLTGIYILVAFSMLACCWFIYFYRQRIISRTKEALLLFTLYSSLMVILWAMDGLGYYFMPILVFALLIAMLVDSRTGVVLNLGFTLIAYFVVDGDMHYMIFFMLSGSMMCLLARYTTERNKIMMVSALAAFFNFVLAIAITLAFEPHQVEYSVNTIVTIGAIAALNGMLTVVVAVGSLPLWEVVFGVVTPIKLLDLTNPTNPLMRRLTIEAPGTYHHSLIVANMAESAAYDIGANPHIARAGGYYHDIGKLKYPQYFAENITGVNPHDDMDPQSSAQIIVSHIAYGLTLAAEYRLPQFLRDIIHEHHGTSIIKYFYCKAKEANAGLDPDNPGSEIDDLDYRYPYNIPQSRESAVVMLADGVEAAVRSMMAQGKDVANMREMIDKMIKDKLTDGSLADSKLSIRDVDTISKSFYRVLKGMYHERVPYPQEVNGEVLMSRR